MSQNSASDRKVPNEQPETSANARANVYPKQNYNSTQPKPDQVQANFSASSETILLRKDMGHASP